jgi:putative oxidoreductase
MSRLLWLLQSILALVFLFSGTFKLALPIEVIQSQLPLPELYIRSIGVLETLGALGLILPALLRIQPSLTPLAAACLAVLLTGATLLTPALTGGQIAPAVLPFVLGVLNVVVAYGRGRIAPIAPRRHAGSALRLAAR